MTNLWNQNTPQKFWLCESSLSEQDWRRAIEKSLPLLGMVERATDLDEALALTLGEGRYGKDHWDLGYLKNSYYLLKPFLPRSFTRLLRKLYSASPARNLNGNWPIDSRYVSFQWELIRQLLMAAGRDAIIHKSFWPGKNQFAFVLTHDIETARGQAFAREIANLEERLGFRSSFNFVLERYPLDAGLMNELTERGFEVGCHGLKHDGKLFLSRDIFSRRAARINAEMKNRGMVGFRSPLTLRNPEWMQSLDIEYDSSFFDTDPFEPIPGGAMSIWPFFLGRFVELPYTLVQDYTLASVLGETTPNIWIEKVEFIKEHRGMALLNTHPDYLKDETLLGIYAEFLQTIKTTEGYWHALPRDVARWWTKRAESFGTGNSSHLPGEKIKLIKDKLSFVA